MKPIPRRVLAGTGSLAVLTQELGAAADDASAKASVIAEKTQTRLSDLLVLQPPPGDPAAPAI